MKKLWTPPTTIQIVSILNNRQLNPDYVESLQDSMETHGYLAEYPIEVFESKNIPSIETDQPYLCACGAHRTLAALKADIDAVLVVIYDGGEEDWIERMSLDNFKFDVVQDSFDRAGVFAKGETRRLHATLTPAEVSQDDEHGTRRELEYPRSEYP